MLNFSRAKTRRWSSSGVPGNPIFFPTAEFGKIASIQFSRLSGLSDPRAETLWDVREAGPGAARRVNRYLTWLVDGVGGTPLPSPPLPLKPSSTGAKACMLLALAAGLIIGP